MKNIFYIFAFISSSLFSRDYSLTTFFSSYDKGDSSSVSLDLSSGVKEIFNTSLTYTALKSGSVVVAWDSDYNNGNDVSFNGMNTSYALLFTNGLSVTLTSSDSDTIVSNNDEVTIQLPSLRRLLPRLPLPFQESLLMLK